MVKCIVKVELCFEGVCFGKFGGRGVIWVRETAVRGEERRKGGGKELDAEFLSVLMNSLKDITPAFLFLLPMFASHQ